EAKKVAENLGIELREISIEPLVNTFENSASPDLSTLSCENLQARIRGTLLMTLSNDENRLLISTANKSEVAMGYSTLYGDMCGSIMPLGDLYKSEVYGLA